jgi:phosphatidylglycerol:prolipoprotein diacylglycerol transferase
MYPYVHDFLNDLFGTNWSLPLPMFGFWVAMAFLAANYLFSSELKRKEKLGLMSSFTVKEVIGKPASKWELIANGFFGFLLGFKLLDAILNYSDLVSNPPDFILSSRGNLLGGLIGGGILYWMKYQEKQKLKLPTPKEVENTVHPYQLVGNMTLIAAIAGIIGAKLFHNLENPDEFDDIWSALFSFSGLSIYGGLIVGGLAVVWYAKKQGLKIVHVIDACAPGLMAAYGVGRIGCQLAGDGDWGVPNDAPMPSSLSFLPEWVWAYDYPNNVLGMDLKADFISMGYESISGKAFPTPFYEVVMALAIFAVLWALRKKITIAGRLFSLYLILNGIERYFIEKIRINPPYHFFGIEATQAEIIAVLLFASGLFGWWYFGKKANSSVQSNGA